MLSSIKYADSKREEGFTLIELLVVVIIIGILAAIAIPTFLRQRERAWERATQSDLRNAAVVAEEYFNVAGTYVGFDPGTSNTSPGVALAPGTMAIDSYCITGTHTNLPNTPDFHLNSTNGSVAPGGC